MAKSSDPFRNIFLKESKLVDSVCEMRIDWPSVCKKDSSLKEWNKMKTLNHLVQ